jgi:hypothetical protein
MFPDPPLAVPRYDRSKSCLGNQLKLWETIRVVRLKTGAPKKITHSVPPFQNQNLIKTDENKIQSSKPIPSKSRGACEEEIRGSQVHEAKYNVHNP